MVMINPWLVRPGTAKSLGDYFDTAWDVDAVIYYRRYFEWITITFENWRQDLFENTISPHMIPSSSFRCIDFLRIANGCSMVEMRMTVVFPFADCVGLHTMTKV